MVIFGEDPKKSVHVWGPISSLKVTIDSFPPVESDEWALVGMETAANEVVDIRRCFNDETYLYALGNDQGRCRFSLSFVVFLAGEECDESKAFNALQKGIDDYAANRISKRTKESTATIGGLSLYGWLDGMTVGNMDADRGICYASVNFIMKLPDKN